MDVVFQEHPLVWLGESWFRNVPTIIQWENIPLMEVGKFEQAGFTTRIAVFHSDGTKIAVVNGSQIYLTAEGKNAQMRLRYEPGLTACELEGRTIFELRREGAAALRATAELHAPEGMFIRTSTACLDIIGQIAGGKYVGPSGFLINKCFAWDMPIGIHITKNIVGIGTAGGPYPKIIGQVSGAEEGETWIGKRLDDNGNVITPEGKVDIHVGKGAITAPPDAPPGFSIPDEPRVRISHKAKEGNRGAENQAASTQDPPPSGSKS